MNNEEQKNDSSESTSGFFALNKRDQNVVSVLLLLIIILSSVYFIFFKELPHKSRYNQNDMSDSFATTTVASQDAHRFTVDEINNSELRDFPYLSELKIQKVTSYNSEFNRIKFVDGIARFEYCISNESCHYNDSRAISTSSKIAEVTLENVTLPSQEISLNGDQFHGDLKGVAIVKIEIAGKIYRYFSSFAIYGDSSYEEARGKNYLYFFHFIALDKNVKIIEIEKGPIFKLTYSDGSIDLYAFSRFTQGEYGFARLTEDRKFKKLEYKPENLKLLYPFESDAYTDYYSTSRAWDAERYNAVKPIYYSNACGLENKFSNADINIIKRTNDGSTGSGFKIHYHMVFGVSNPDFETMYLTSASWGYSADDWNKILSTLKYKNYLDSVKSGKTLSGEPTTQLNIAGKKINYIPEKKLPRPCDEWNFDQYIWAEKDRVFTLRVRNIDTPKQEMDKIISDLIGSINVTE